jgi:hypothetical protein
MGLSSIPLCAAFPMDRLLIFSGIGAFGLLAMLLESTGVWPWGSAGGAGWRSRGAWLLLIVHGPLAACLLVVRTAALPVFGEFFTVAAREAPDGPEVTTQTFVFVNGNDFPVIYCRMIRQVEGSAPAPRRVAQLASITTSNSVFREDARTLVITPEGGFLAYSLDRLLASPNRRFGAGERIERPDFVAEIRSITPDHRPAEVAFRFRQPLESPSLRWLCWTDERLVDYSLPAVGERAVLRENFPVLYH